MHFLEFCVSASFEDLPSMFCETTLSLNSFGVGPAVKFETLLLVRIFAARVKGLFANLHCHQKRLVFKRDEAGRQV